MPIPLPNLDDLTYAELTAEARALIPVLQPAWTNHNASDPGIALVELLAWHTEMLLYQVNEIPEGHRLKFLILLNGASWTRPDGVSIDTLVRQTMADLRERYRAVTAEDFEHLALHAWPSSPAAEALGRDAGLRRVRCVPRRDLSAADAEARHQQAPAHVSVVVVPEPVGDEEHPQPTAGLLSELRTFFEPRRTLTTRHHVVGPGYVDTEIAATLALRADAAPDAALRDVTETLAAFCSPLRGGVDGEGWPLGRDVHASEVYTLLDGIDSVDYIENVALRSPGRGTDAGEGEPDLRLDDHELVHLRKVDLTAHDVYGQTHRQTASFP